MPRTTLSNKPTALETWFSTRVWTSDRTTSKILQQTKIKKWIKKARKTAAEYFLKVLLLQYNTVQLWDNAQQNHQLQIVCGFYCSAFWRQNIQSVFDYLDGTIFGQCNAQKKYGAKLIVLRQKLIKAEENSKTKRKPSGKVAGRSCVISFRPNP